MNATLTRAQQFASDVIDQFREDIMTLVIEPDTIGNVPEPINTKTDEGWKIAVSNKTPYDFVATFKSGERIEFLEKPF